MSIRRSRLSACCAAVVLTVSAAAAHAAAESPDALFFVDGSQLAGDVRVIDVRDGGACAEAALADARCLPAADLFDGEGRPARFHALRWLFGTVGLTGGETVLVVADDAGNAAAVGALLFLAGQAQVAILDRPLEVAADPSGGQSRSLTREAVFVAPMRDRLLLTGAADDAEPIARLTAFARDFAGGNASARLSLTP